MSPHDEFNYASPTMTGTSPGVSGPSTDVFAPTAITVTVRVREVPIDEGRLIVTIIEPHVDNENEEVEA